MESRYDDIAAWYAEFAGELQPVCLPYLPEALEGQRVLDLACGQGALSRLLGDRGALVTALDASPGMLNHTKTTSGVQYRQGDATDTQWWNGDPFNAVVCNMALMDITDLDAALATIVTVLQPGGWAMLALLHPCFPGQPDTETLSSWPPEHGYSWEGWWTTGSDGVRGHVGAYHRTLSTYLNAVIRAGLEITEIIEPPSDVPRFLILRCRNR